MTVISKPAFEPEKFVIKILDFDEESLVSKIELNRDNEGQSIDSFNTRLNEAVKVWERKVLTAIEQTKARILGMSESDLKSTEIPLMPHFRGHLGLKHIELIKEKINTWFTFSKAPKPPILIDEISSFPYVLRPYFFDGIDGLFLLQETPYSKQKVPVLFFVIDEYVKFAFTDKLKYFEGVFNGLAYNFKGFIDSPDFQKKLIIQEVKKPIKVPVSNVDLIEYGTRVGRLYKAWSIILQSPDYFIDGFENEKQKNEVAHEPMKTVKPKEKQVNANDFKGEIDELTSNIVEALHEHFEQYSQFMFDKEFKKAKGYLMEYFKGELTKDFEQIKFKKKGLKKRLCYHLGQIHKDLNSGEKFTNEYYEFLRNRFEPLSNISESHFEVYQRTDPKKGA